MTTQITPSDPIEIPGADPETVAALRAVLAGHDDTHYARVRAAVLALGDLPMSGLTYAQEAELGPVMLRQVIAELGGSARDIDTGLLCEWAAIAAPNLLPVLSGHFDLALGALRSLGTGSDYQQRCLADLDTGAAVGLLMLTELGGTNGANQQTTATWDSTTGGFRLNTTDILAMKFMPNAADPAVSKIAVVTARLRIGGRDEGVFAFLLRLRDAEGRLAPGVEAVALPDKTGAPMDHAMVVFRDCPLPAEALLAGDWARIDSGGHLDCDLPWGQRFSRTISVLGDGRLDLACAAVASARAALTGLVNYASQRQPSTMRMIDRDPVQYELAAGLAAVYACSVLGRQLRQMRGKPGWSGLYSMVAKPLLSETAYQVLVTCRRRCGAQGALRLNYIADWIANCDGIITAEGENQIMQVTAGKTGFDLTDLRLPGTPAQLTPHIERLRTREHLIATGMHRSNFSAAGPIWGADNAAIELATATGERLAATALLIAADTVTNDTAAAMIRAAADAYALDRIWKRGGWYTANALSIGEQAHETQRALIDSLRTLADGTRELVAAFDIPALPGAAVFDSDYTRPYRLLAHWDDSSTTT
ncbi:acyl-CoA dehydrogenase family protein [Nocardia blacklockiae]|uniref:acyl-CoA dehydrogenase family protein n=1 Tax=Nocardia blacklockiae TaxID=480036 RepID=UPI0018941B9A|nr:acyl-CoA dehydrogenase family protein [Nocardia blacklockiae]MBF6171070.1 hypothetical protein [Nocardia blacklockiae]